MYDVDIKTIEENLYGVRIVNSINGGVVFNSRVMYKSYDDLVKDVEVLLRYSEDKYCSGSSWF